MTVSHRWCVFGSTNGFIVDEGPLYLASVSLGSLRNTVSEGLGHYSPSVIIMTVTRWLTNSNMLKSWPRITTHASQDSYTHHFRHTARWTLLSGVPIAFGARCLQGLGTGLAGAQGGHEGGVDLLLFWVVFTFSGTLFLALLFVFFLIIIIVITVVCKAKTRYELGKTLSSGEKRTIFPIERANHFLNLKEINASITSNLSIWRTVIN